jgi:hypothetical protein
MVDSVLRMIATRASTAALRFFRHRNLVMPHGNALSLRLYYWGKGDTNRFYGCRFLG